MLRKCSAEIERYWDFKTGSTPNEKTRRSIRSAHGGSKLRSDIFVDQLGIESCTPDNDAVHHVDFIDNATRPMRFERRAFLNMIKIATDIDLNTSPVCFRHAHGRGILVERTLGSGVPDFEASND